MNAPAPIIHLAILSEFPRSEIELVAIHDTLRVTALLPWWRSLTRAQRAANAVEIKSIADRLWDGQVRAHVLPPSLVAMFGDVALLGIVVAMVGWVVAG